MNIWNDEQERLARADLYERIARTLRDGTVKPIAIDRAAEYAGQIAADEIGAADYRSALSYLGVLSPERDAAVASIARGEHPPDSLPGRVEKMRSDAEGANVAAPVGSRLEGEAAGSELTACQVLDLLGCKAPRS